MKARLYAGSMGWSYSFWNLFPDDVDPGDFLK
jgi:hypothetical protein